MSEAQYLTAEEMSSLFSDDFDDSAVVEDEGSSMDSFSFDDVLAFEAEEAETAEYEEDEEAEDEDIEDEEDEEVNEVEDLEEDEELEAFTKTFTSRFSDLSDDHVFDFGDIQLSKSDLVDAVIGREEVKQKNEAISNYIDSFKHIDQEMSAAFVSSLTEVDESLKVLQHKIDNNLFKTKDEQYQAIIDRDALQKRKGIIDQRIQTFNQARKIQEQRAAEYRINSVDETMNKRYGLKWEKVIAPRIVSFAAQSGLSQEFMVGQASPELMEILYKASQFDEIRNKNSKAVNSNFTEKKASKAPRSKKATKSFKPAERNEASKALLKKMEKTNGMLSGKDQDILFKLLED